jgi:hypothetical protein
MSSPLRLSLVGMSPVDYSLLVALFVPTGKSNWSRGMSFDLIKDWRQAELIVANADDAVLVRKLRACQLNATVLLIGASAGGTGWPCLPKPIQMHIVMDMILHLNPHFIQERASMPAELTMGPGSFFAPSDVSPLAEREDVTASQPLGGAQAFDDSDILLWRDRMGTDSELQSVPFHASQPFAHAAAPAQSPSVAGPATGFGRTAKAQAMSAQAKEAQEAQEDDGAGAYNLTSSGVYVHSLSPSSIEPSEAERSPQPESRRKSKKPKNEPMAGRTQQIVLLVGGRRLLDCSLTQTLLNFGYMVEFAHDLRAAQVQLQSKYYFVVMLDASSLGSKTLLGCWLLRKIVFQPQRLVVLANHGGVHRHLGQWVGCDHWLQKPLQRKTLKYFLRDYHAPTYGVA